MNCLNCGKPLGAFGKNSDSDWHPACIKRFFGTNEMPEISIDKTTLDHIAKESVNRGFTIPGVQKKLSLHLHSEKGQHRLTIVNYPTGYILKPQVEEFESLPEAEHLVMCMAASVGISTVPNALIQDRNKLAYITKRIDRILTDEKLRMHGVEMLAMEDFCQLDLRLTQDKYKGSYERCAKIIDRYSSRKGLDMTELFMRLVFSFVVGNSDMHLKNFSLIETGSGSGQYVLSPAYDLLPVNIILPEDKEQFALTMNGKKTNLDLKDFLFFADNCGISKNAAKNMTTRIVSAQGKFVSMCKESHMPVSMQDSLINLMDERIACLI